MFPVSPEEERVFALLIEAGKGSNATLRVAGGWVRDKLMGLPSDNDIDIAVEGVSGVQYANIVAAYVEKIGLDMRGFSVIKSNPEKSKHLETATMQILDFWVDFAGLRGEAYAEDSRIPEITEGTPEEDSHRRDFTVNALYYNLHSKQVEDFTLNGLNDLDKKILRTPLPPLKTFLDDPLRVLRGLRFASRLGFEIEASAWEAMDNEMVKSALSQKVSKERVGKEVLGAYKILKNGAEPLRMMELAHKLGLLAPLLLIKPEDAENGIVLCRKAEPGHAEFIQLMGEDQSLELSPDQAGMIGHLALLTFPASLTWGPIKSHTPHKPAFEGLKMTKRFCETLQKIQTQLKALLEIFRSPESKSEFPRVEFAMWIRESGQIWRAILILFEALVEFPSRNQLEDKAKIEKIDDFWAAKPLFEGNELRTIFKLQGKQIGEKLKEVLVYQALNPGKTKEDYLKERAVSS